MPEFDIICDRCGKKSRITAKDGKLCLNCWREVRKENRLMKQQESLNKCFSYKFTKQLTDREASIVNEIMIELEPKDSKK
jgi:hypothetical protein